MPGKPAARIGDMHACNGLMPGAPPVPYAGGPIIEGVETVVTGNQKQATVTHKCICPGSTDAIAEGAETVLVNNLPAARLGDHTIRHGIIVEGDLTVLIGNEAAPGTAGASLPVHPETPSAETPLHELKREAPKTIGLPPSINL
ncbi:MAG: PAAR domain-containing protein [Acidobacteria bacterium]|nr:PAAR domain-containing protein [Acidobacteriota bacterium]